jgi:hypothetical protein
MKVRELVRQLKRTPGDAEVLFIGPSAHLEVTKYALFQVPQVIETVGLSPQTVDFVVDPEPRDDPPIVFLTTDIRDIT